MPAARKASLIAGATLAAAAGLLSNGNLPLSQSGFVSGAEARIGRLREHFGDAYHAYCSRTWRLIPGIY